MQSLPRYPILNRKHSLARGLVAAWPFYERGGAVVRDLGVSRLNAAFVATPTWALYDGRLGLDFNGTDQGLSIGTQTALDLAVSNFTISGWLRRDVTTTYGMAYVRQGATAQYWLGWCHSADGTAAHRNKALVILDFGAGNVRFVGSATHTDNGVWHHVAVTYDGANVRIYWDGILESTTAQTGAIASKSYAAFIGEDGAGTWTDGKAADVRIWRRTLTAKEINGLYRDPAAMYRGPRLSYVYQGAPDSVTWHDASPADGATQVNPVDTATVRVTPFDGASNPIAPSTRAVTINGVAGTVTATNVGGYVYELDTDFLFVLGKTYTIVWYIETTDANPNTYTQTFTVRDEEGGGEGVVEYSVWSAGPGTAVVELGVGAASPHNVVLEWVSMEAGLRAAMDAVLEFTLLPAPNFLTTAEGLLMFVVTVYEENIWCVSADIGEAGQYDHPLAADISGTWEDTWALAAEIRSDNNSDVCEMLSLDVVEAHEDYLAISLDVGEGGEFVQALSADVVAAYFWLLVLARLRSEQYAAEEGG